MLRVVGVSDASDLPCILEFDDYIPVRFRTSAEIIPGDKVYLRAGDIRSSLFDVVVSKDSKLLRGFSATLVDAVHPNQLRGPDEFTLGLPVIDLQEQALNASLRSSQQVDLGIDFSIRLESSMFEIKFGGAEDFDFRVRHGKVDFLLLVGHIVGIRINDLEDNEADKIKRHIERIGFFH